MFLTERFTIHLKKKVAVTYCKTGRGLIKINGTPIELVQPEILRYKVFEPILLLGRSKFNGVDMRIRVKGGGHTSQIYAIRQSIAKALVAYYQKFVDEQQKKEIKDILVRYDRTLLVADPRRCEPKKFGRGYPLSLSISISGGKETYKDSPSNGERTGNSPALESGGLAVRIVVWRSVLCGGPGPSPLEWDAREGESPVVPGPCRTTRRCRRVGLFGNAAPSGR